MMHIPVRLDFAKRNVVLETGLHIPNAAYANIFREIVKSKGWIGLDEAAERFGRSPWQFSRLFSSAHGQFFGQTKLAIRIELSALPVILTTWYLSEIAETFAYSHLKKWEQPFKQHLGMTPSEGFYARSIMSRMSSEHSQKEIEGPHHVKSG